MAHNKIPLGQKTIGLTPGIRGWVALAGGLLLVMLGGANLARVRSLGMDTHLPFWVVDAIPPALSDLSYGLRGDYTSLKAVSEAFYGSLGPNIQGDPGRNAAQVNRAIAQALSLNPMTISRKTVLLSGDDKGIVDLVKLTFLLFGRDSARIIYGYFAILFFSIILFVASFRTTFLPLVLAALFLAAHYSILPLAYYNPQLQSVLALRFLPVLALVACLHCLYFTLWPQVTPVGVGSLMLQIVILVFTIHLRSVAIWQVALITLAGAAHCSSREREEVHDPGRVGLRFRFHLRPATLLPALLALIGLLGLSQYRKSFYHERYRNGEVMTTRPFWHNIISGFAFQPYLARRYQLKVDDSSEAHATGRFLTEEGRGAEWSAIGGMMMTEPWIWSSGFSRLRLGAYDRLAREFFWSVAYQHPFAFLSTFVYYKPVSLVRHLLWVYGFRRDIPDIAIFVSPDVGDAMAVQLAGMQENVDRLHLRFSLWNPAALLTGLALALIWSSSPLRRSPRQFQPVAWVVAGSLLPSVVGYPGMHTIAEPILLVAIGIDLVFVYALVQLLTICRHAHR
jgi:hypothetical protein